MREIVCHCFGYTAEDIKEDALENGRSTILARIVAEKAAGGCHCSVKNPKSLRWLAAARRAADSALGRVAGLPDGGAA
jgi:hypothetical protein